MFNFIMNNEILGLIFRFLTFGFCWYIYNCFLFFRTQNRYCKKNKGNCKTCNCWSCSRFHFLDKNGNLK